jgi:hypothetical protein
VEAAVDEGEVPSGHFSDLVAAFALAAPIGECGESAVGVSGDVVEVPDRCIALKPIPEMPAATRC